MFKKIGFSAAALALCGMAALANGCSSTSTSSVGPVTDSGPVTDGKVVPHPDSGGNDGSPSTCYDITTAFAYNFAAPKAYQNVCTLDQINGYFTACFSPGTAATCTAYVDANPYCAICIGADTPAADSGVVYDAGLGNDGSASQIPYPALVQVDQSTGLTTTNLDGCIAALSTGTPACDLADDQLSTCISSSCASCTQGDNAAQTACLNAAQADTSGCSSQYVLDSTCQAAITASQTANATACGGDKTDFQGQFTATATVLCGAHP